MNYIREMVADNMVYSLLSVISSHIAGNVMYVSANSIGSNVTAGTTPNSVIAVIDSTNLTSLAISKQITYEEAVGQPVSNTTDGGAGIFVTTMKAQVDHLWVGTYPI